MKTNKYLYLFVIQQNWGYGYGWEDVCAEEFWKEGMHRLKEYRINQPETPARMIQRREPNPDYRPA